MSITAENRDSLFYLGACSQQADDGGFIRNIYCILQL